MKNNRDKRVSANLTEDVYSKFMAEANKQGRSASNLLTYLITQYLANKEAE